MLDIPNDRSSHTRPTPRGGGLVIVVVALIFYGLISYFYPEFFSWGYLIGALLVALISWLDDIYTVPVIWRLVTHAISATLIIADKGGWNEAVLPGVSPEFALGYVGPILTFLWIVWLINAYNFMDGIDGIAGIQAVVAGLGWLWIGWLSGAPDLALFAGVIFSTSLGFLFHNWHPAKIFMGDVGSAFLGFTFSTMPLIARSKNVRPGALLPIAAIIFVWFFLFDSIVTFVRRAIRGEKVWKAHREHLYQRLVTSSLSHGTVSTVYGFMMLIVSIPVLLAYSSRSGYELLIIPVMIVVTIMFILFGAKRGILT